MTNFPIKVFDDIDGADFEKHNKKQVTEDFVSENFKELGWSVYRPLNDTGIDLIAMKRVCPQNHTKYNEITKNLEKCSQCKKSLIQITRFIQVKTREIKGDSGASQFFGYTLKSKDFRTDPRHVFLLYSDYSNDFLIIPMYDYLKIFHDNQDMGKTHFGTPAFRQGNNKLNSLRRETNGNWRWRTRTSQISFDDFVNENGIKKISKCDYDTQFDTFKNEIVKMKFRLFFTYSKGRETDAAQEKWINGYLSDKVTNNQKSILKQRSKTKAYLSENLSTNLKKSIEEGYLVKFKGVSFS